MTARTARAFHGRTRWRWRSSSRFWRQPQSLVVQESALPWGVIRRHTALEYHAPTEFSNEIRHLREVLGRLNSRVNRQQSLGQHEPRLEVRPFAVVAATLRLCVVHNGWLGSNHVCADDAGFDFKNRDVVSRQACGK